MRTIDIERDEVAAVNGPDEEARRIRRQRLRSTAIAFGLAFLVLLFYAATIVRIVMPGKGARAEARRPAPAVTEPASIG